MTQPSVIITELDGALGVLPPSAGRLHAIIGPTATGTPNVPVTYGRIQDIQAAFTGGPAVESAAHYMTLYGRPVLFMKSAANTPAQIFDPVELTGTGTSVVTTTGDSIDNYEIRLKVRKGGTIGTAGITYVLSLDAGRTYGAEQSLGTSTTVVVGGVTLHFAVGTLVAGDIVSLTALAATWNTADLTAALQALKGSAALWELLQVVGPIDAADVGVLDLAFSGMAAMGKYRAWIGNTRISLPGETEAEYQGVLTTLVGAASRSKYGSLYGGGHKLVSAISGNQYRRPVSFSVAAREANVSQEINIADVNLGVLPGASLRDKNGNPDEHDESISPGLDDLGLGCLRTWDGEGVYVNRPRLFSPSGSDFQLMPHRRVMNLTLETLRTYFIRRLNRPVLVSSTTGFILESEALEIEGGVMAQLRAALLAKPKASAVFFTLSRTDDLLSTRTLTGSCRVVPLAYPEEVQLDVGFFNPALQVQAA